MSDETPATDFTPCLRAAVALTVMFEMDRAGATRRGLAFAGDQAGRRAWYSGYCSGSHAGFLRGFDGTPTPDHLPAAICAALELRRQARIRALLDDPEYQRRREERRAASAEARA